MFTKGDRVAWDSHGDEADGAQEARVTMETDDARTW